MKLMTLGKTEEKGGGTQLVDFSDPFSKNKVARITIFICNWEAEFAEPKYAGRIDFEAQIKFKNGNTTGEQKITAPDFVTMVDKVNKFIKAMR